MSAHSLEITLYASRPLSFLTASPFFLFYVNFVRSLCSRYVRNVQKLNHTELYLDWNIESVRIRRDLINVFSWTFTNNS